MIINGINDDTLSPEKNGDTLPSLNGGIFFSEKKSSYVPIYVTELTEEYLKMCGEHTHTRVLDLRIFCHRFGQSWPAKRLLKQRSVKEDRVAC